MTKTAALEREVFFDIGERLDKLLLNVAIVLPPPKITQQQALDALCNDDSPEGLKTLARLLADIEPLLTFLESELVPALADGANDLEAITKRETLQRQEEPKTESPKSEPAKPETEKPAA